MVDESEDPPSGLGFGLNVEPSEDDHVTGPPSVDVTSRLVAWPATTLPETLLSCMGYLHTFKGGLTGADCLGEGGTGPRGPNGVTGTPGTHDESSSSKISEPATRQ